ncbi:MAG: dicarboxylate/amino acid:cation symporter [Salibacteraceae bacterium]|nr:dicarboxylate/amino acid:cation symporter [Salibacteraceae bacterium]|tara:strand:- start:39733 stop:41145 length:1413 start_codon:yes stop_codon:yes gene_type:complete
MKGMPLYVKILIGLILGAIWSFISSAMGWNQFTIDWIDPFGQIFIRLLKFIAVPLVLFSVVTGIASLNDVSKLGRMGGKTLLIYLITTVCAVSIGLLIGNVVKPGTFIDPEQRIKNRINYEYWATNNGVEILDGKYYSSDPKYATLVKEVEQKNGDELSVEDRKNIEEKLKVVSKNETRGPLYFLVDMVPENIVLSISDNKLMLQVIFFAIFLGITLIMIPSKKAQPIISFFEGMSEVFLKMVDLIMKAAPIFVFALMAGVIAKMADTPAEVFEIFKSLGAYSIAVFVGLAFMVAVFYPLIVKFVAKIGYSDFFRKISPAQFLAFSTSSSAATLPVTMECVEDNIGVSKNVSSFVLPIGATVNMDGTSMYQTIAVLFLAQLHMVDLTLAQQLTIVLTATLASIGSAAVPSAGLVMLMIVLISVGLNPAWIAIIFPVDRILDMCRTVVNVTGDATVSTIIAKGEGELNLKD